ncbi:MAG: 16S rRNA (adenine(1518)-N(6)/adenine(1519)-N(6))-dimethyltransferase RsmA [Prevotellaceae bacterium]|nr:16S rRNA (adenine(1518)-N(6)/adenine(1519)-N(6))-dimethyltransferase RsmA [Candidatus Colivivens equi]MCQ2076597.1 16S rRNA (adenine(1518)-N(6)/adenine(1519)-N(6))-dimethyltransferase RsmA [Bacteroidaceae bacterium]
MNYVRPKKSLGQHFLTDMGIASRIADTIDACKEIPVLEVGPGTGVLTQFLMQKNRELKVVELDNESVSYLLEHFNKLAPENIISADFLKMNLMSVFDGHEFVLTGNYPYNISSQIFFKVVDNRTLIPCCTGMVQKEVAERLAAQPGTKSYGVLSIFIQAWYDVEYLFTVHENVFNPPPKVKSAVICMTRNSRESLGCDVKLFRQIVKTVFTMRRKMVRNGLKQVLSGMIDKDISAEFLSDSEFNKRPEQMSIEEFISLTNRISALQHV